MTLTLTAVTRQGHAMFVSYDLRDSRGFPACRGADYIRLGAGLHAAVEPGQGLISACRGPGLDLRFYGVSAQAAWLELGLKLAGAGPGARDRAWRGSRRFYCRLRLAHQLAEPEGRAGEAPQPGPEPEPVVADQARLALRLHQPEGFEDIFAPDPLPIGTEFSWIRAEITPPLSAQAALRGVDLHLFLPPCNGSLQVSDLGVTAVT